MNLDPYTELGVALDADEKTIKRAFRRRARETHPDAGGSEGAFERTKRASLVLLDPKRRAQYDRDGTIDEEQPDNALAEVLVAISQLLDAAMVLCDKDRIAPVETSIIKTMMSLAAESKRGIAQTRGSIEHHLHLSETLIDRFRPKAEGEPNRLALLLGQRIAAQQMNLAKLKHDEDVLDRAVEMLKSYTFRQEAPTRPEQRQPPPFPPFAGLESWSRMR